MKFLVQGRSQVPSGSLRSRANVDVCDGRLPRTCTKRCVRLAIAFQCLLPGPLHSPGENRSVYTRDYCGSSRVFTAVIPRKIASDRAFLASFRGMPTPQPA